MLVVPVGESVVSGVCPRRADFAIVTNRQLECDCLRRATDNSPREARQ